MKNDLFCNKKMCRNIRIILFLLISFFIFGCDEEKNYLMPYLDVSPDNNTIAYTYYDTLSSSIYEFSLADSAIVRITKSAEEHYYRPRYSPDGTKIMMLAVRLTGKGLPRILMYSKIDKSMKQISDDATQINEAEFSPTGEGIYFIAAASYGKYSPVASSGPHGNDIYYIDTNGNNLRKITHLNAYAMNGLAVTKDAKIIFTDIWQTGNDSNRLEGLYAIPISSPEKIQKYTISNTISRLWNTEKPKNRNLNEGENHYFTFWHPTISKNGKKLLISPPNELIEIDIATHTAKTLTEPFGGDKEWYIGDICSPCFFYDDTKIALRHSKLNKSAINSTFARPNLIIVDLTTKKLTRYNLDNKRVLPEEQN